MNYLKRVSNYIVLIWQFSVDDFRQKYAGSVFGVSWAFLQPIITIAIYWFVFQLGFKSGPVADCPFILWLMAGLIPWFFVNEALLNVTTCLADYSYLVKKVLFKIEILPIVRIVSVLFVQLVLIAFTILCFAIGGYRPVFCYVEIVLYVLYMIVITVAVGYFTSTLFAFFKDTIQFVSIILQMVFWFTPIVYSLDSMPEWVKRIMIFNPIYYVVSGFRSVFVYREVCAFSVGMITYYWVVALVILIIGRRLFIKCKKHFADVL